MKEALIRAGIYMVLGIVVSSVFWIWFFHDKDEPTSFDPIILQKAREVIEDLKGTNAELVKEHDDVMVLLNKKMQEGVGRLEEVFDEPPETIIGAHLESADTPTVIIAERPPGAAICLPEQFSMDVVVTQFRDQWPMLASLTHKIEGKEIWTHPFKGEARVVTKAKSRERQWFLGGMVGSTGTYSVVGGKIWKRSMMMGTIRSNQEVEIGFALRR